jgi:(R,R)-butanediol dehydrogenase/meso-butanediol dehydrogenase/diacetyl reductase/L-iditol 2-dehydrogenase
VAVYGAGGLGMLTVELLRLAGAIDISIIEPIKEKREEGVRLGAKHAFDPNDEDFVEKARAVTDGRGFERTIEMSGNYVAAELALKTISRGGKIVYFSNYHPGYRLPIEAFSLVNDEIFISGIFQSPYMFPRVMSIISDLDLGFLTRTVFPMEKIEEAWAAHMSKKYPKVVLKIAQDVDI